MTDLSRSTAHRMMNIRMHGLVLAALRLGLSVSKSSVSLDLVESKWENKESPRAVCRSAETESNPTVRRVECLKT